VSTGGENDLLTLVLLNSSFDTIGIAGVSKGYRRCRQLPLNLYTFDAENLESF